MKSAHRNVFQLSVIGIAATLLGVVSLVACAQDAKPVSSSAAQPMGVPEDWSHHRLVFSNPGTEEDAIRNGTHDKWLRINNDPRFLMQQIRRHKVTQYPEALAALQQKLAKDSGESDIEGVESRIPPISTLKSKAKTIKQDWSEALTTASVMPNTYPAKYSFSTTGTPSCTNDFAVYPTGTTGSSTLATIIAYNNLYVAASGSTSPSGPCEVGSSPNPTVDWAFNTTISGTTAGSVTTSPVLSLDGTEVAFVQSTSTAAYLVVVKVLAGSGTSVTAPHTFTSAASNSNCTAPCMTAIKFSSSGDTYSSPFVDYFNNVLYVGDNNSTLYKISNVFESSTALAVASVSLNGTAYDVASPVYDSVTGCVFVGDSEGYLYSVDPITPGGSVCNSAGPAMAVHATSALLGRGSSDEGIFDAPLVDSNAGTVYAFVAYNSSHDNEIAQFLTNFTGSSAAANGTQNLGSGSQAISLYAGSFDNIYYESTSSSSPSGNIYVVGNVSGTTANLYRIPVASNLINTTPSQLFTVGNGSYYPWASPITEFCNNGSGACTILTGGTCGTGITCTNTGTDTIYFSTYASTVAGSGACNSGSGNGCILAYNVNKVLTSSSTPSGTQNVTATSAGGGSYGCFTTGAFIIDNASINTGSSQIYFVNLNGNSPSTVISGQCSTGTGKTTQAVQNTQSIL